MKTARLTKEEVRILDLAAEMQEKDEKHHLCLPSTITGYLARKYNIATVEDLVRPNFSIVVQKGVISTIRKKGADVT